MAKKHSVLTNNDLHNPKGILVHSTGSMLVMSQSISTATASFHFIPDDTDTYTLGNTARAWKELYVSTGSIHFVEKDGTVARTLEVDATGFGFGGGDVSGSTISGSKLHIVGDAFIGGDLTLGDADTDSISIGADITSNLIPNADATYDLGSSSKGWNDIHLGSGGVINLDGGDVTLTHAAGKITLGGDGAVEFDFADHEMTNVDIDGGAIDGTAIGAASHTTIKGTTIDATTDFTIGGTVITDNTITDDGTLVIASTTATSFSDGNITNVGDINADSLSVDDAAVGLDINFGGNTTLNKITLTDNLADALNINEGGTSYIKFTTTDSSEQIVVGKNSTFNGTTIADLGTVTTANIDGGTVDGTTIGASSHTTIKGTTIDATTDFTIGGTVITDNTITDDGTLVIASTTATSFSEGNITNVGDIALDTISADDGSSLSFSNNWTNAGNTIADLGSVTTCDINGGTINGITDLAVADGGTGASTLTDGGVLLGSGTGAITATAVLANGELLIGDNSTDPTVATLTGTSNQITVTNGGGSITLSTPQSIDTSADVTFDSLTLDDLTAGRVVFSAADGLLSDDSDFTFSTDTLTVTKLGAYEQAGSVDFSDEAMTNVNIDSGAIDGTVIGAATPASGSFTGIIVTGGMEVRGDLTYVSSSNLDIGDRIVTLNAGSAAGDGGLYINDADTTETGSLLWDVSEDRWIGGLKDAEVNLVTISSTDTLTNKTLTSPDINTPDIDGGTIDNTVIGAATQAAGDFTAIGAVAAGTIVGTTIDATTDFTIGTTVITDDSIVMTPSTDDTATIAASTNGALTFTTVDTAAAAANLLFTIDGTAEIASAGLITLDSGAAINIEPAAGSAILLDGTISIDAGVVTGATSITSTALAGELTGNSSTATALAATGNIAMTGDVAWNVDFSGANVTAAGTIQANAVQTGMVHDDVATELAGAGTTATSGVINVIGGDGITANANDVAVTAAQTTITSVLNTGLKVGYDNDDCINFSTGSNGQISVYQNAIEEFRFTAGGTFHADADVVAYSSTVASDMNLKENITDMKYGLSDVMKLRGVEYDWKREDMGHDVGVLAQEVEQVIPELVKEHDGLHGRGKFKSVDYNKLVPVLIESIKELKKEIDDLKSN